MDTINPAIEIAKTPDLQTIVSGSTVTFTIAVTNTGDVTLTNVTVSDALVPNCAASLGTLAADDSASYECTLANVTADFINSVTVTGTPPVGDDVTDTDTAFVDTINPAIEIAKTPDVQTVASGTTVTFTIIVTNTGDVTLTNVAVSDTQAPNCAASLGTLAADDSASYECTLSNVTDGFINSATVAGTPPVGEDVTDADAAKVKLDEAQTCPTDMIAYWKLDETSGITYDDFYDGHDGECAGQCPAPASGHVNGGQAFNGNNTGIDVSAVPGDDSFNWGVNDSFSIEFWMQTDSASTCSGNEVVIGRDDSSTDLHWWAGCQNGGEAAFYLRDKSGTLAGVIGTTDLTDGNWHQVVALRDASTDEIRIYVDGAEEDSESVTYLDGFDSPTAALNIGWLNRSHGYHFEGIADEVALYDRTLSADDIRQHYNEGLAGRWYCEAGTFAPIIVSTPVTDATIGRLYTYDVEAAGDPEPTYALLTNPNGMTIDPTTGLISWTPTVAQKGDHDVEVEASNSEGTDTQSFTISVNEGTLCPEDMIAYWKLDETSGTAYGDFYDGHDGACAGDCPTPAIGHLNGGQEFDGNNTGIDVPADAAFDWGIADSFSVEFWMQTDSASTCSGNEVVIGRDDSSTDLHWWAGCQDGGEAAFYLRDKNGTLAGVVGTTDLTDGNWHHVVAIRDASANEIRIYVDGTEENVTTATYTAGFDSTAALNIGWLNLSQGHHFEGIADEVALYDRALSTDEIQQHYYNEGGNGPGYCINPDIALSKTANSTAVYLSDTVIYTYTVTNPGDTSLSNITLSDDKCSPMASAGGDDNSNSKLDPDETWIYTCSKNLDADTTNTATVTGTHSLNGTVSDEDTLFVNVINPGIAIDKMTDAVHINAGDTVVYTYTVTNPGDDPLSSVNVSDDKCSPVTLLGGDNNGNYQLDPGETWTYTCSMTLDADTTNTATATGTDSADNPVSATDTASVDVRDSTLIIIKEANDDDTVFEFTLSGNSEPFHLRNGESVQFSGLASGSYTITETIGPEWELIGVTCTNGFSVTAPTLPQITIDLQSGQVSCTFENYNRGLADPYPYKVYLPVVLKNH